MVFAFMLSTKASINRLELPLEMLNSKSPNVIWIRGIPVMCCMVENPNASTKYLNTSLRHLNNSTRHLNTSTRHFNAKSYFLWNIELKIGFLVLK
jgi:hypothetical protein